MKIAGPILLMLLLLVSGVQAETQPLAQEPSRIAERGWGDQPLVSAGGERVDISPDDRVDKLLTTFAKDTPGLVLAVMLEGEPVMVRAAGMADLTHGVSFDADTPTNIGSTAKQFLGLALALLIERGEIELDEDVRRYLPELPEFDHVVTLRHLASHTSGYREILNTLALAGWRLDKGDHIRAEEAFTVVVRQPALQNEPGGEWNYNNTGYVLLAEVIARVSGQPFEQFLAERIFQPLGMSSTVIRADSELIVPGRAAGYSPRKEGFAASPDLTGTVGAGSVYTTANDMLRWMNQLIDFRIGGLEARKLMTTPFEMNDGRSSRYGLGLQVDEYRGLERWHHGGGDIAHRAHFVFYPEKRGGYLVFSNHAELPASIAEDLNEIFFSRYFKQAEPDTDKSSAEPAMEAFDPAAYRGDAFERYIGRYELENAPGMVLRFFRDGERLMTQATGQPAFEIEPVASHRFRIVDAPIEVSFEMGADGSASGLTLHQNGDHPGHRLADEEELIDFSVYTGRYYSEELETFYSIRSGQAGLELIHRRFDPIALSHGNADRFAGEFPIHELVFERDDAGRVVALRVSNVRTRDVRFERVN